MKSSTKMIYELETGKISGIIVSNSDQNNVSEGYSIYNGYADTNTYYIKDNMIVERPDIPLNLSYTIENNKNFILLNNVEYAKVIIDGITKIFQNEDLIINFEKIGTYDIEIEMPFPYKQKEITITVI